MNPNIQDTIIYDYRPTDIRSMEPVQKSVKIETALGSIESDSGSHLVDVGTILLIMVAFFAMKKFYQST